MNLFVVSSHTHTYIYRYRREFRWRRGLFFQKPGGRGTRRTYSTCPEANERNVFRTVRMTARDEGTTTKPWEPRTIGRKFRARRARKKGRRARVRNYAAYDIYIFIYTRARARARTSTKLARGRCARVLRARPVRASSRTRPRRRTRRRPPPLSFDGVPARTLWECDQDSHGRHRHAPPRPCPFIKLAVPLGRAVIRTIRAGVRAHKRTTVRSISRPYFRRGIF